MYLSQTQTQTQTQTQAQAQTRTQTQTLVIYLFQNVAVRRFDALVIVLNFALDLDTIQGKERTR
jgi:hypothetical protein